MKEHQTGFGTGEDDQLFETEGQALSALAKWLRALGIHSPGRRLENGTLVRYQGKNRRGQAIVVDIRHDLNDPHPETTGSFDVKIKRNGVGGSKHFGHKRR